MDSFEGLWSLACYRRIVAVPGCFRGHIVTVQDGFPRARLRELSDLQILIVALVGLPR